MTAPVVESNGFVLDALEAFVALAGSRRSVSPRRLARPAPSLGEIRRFVEAAVAAPDHGLLRPWRFTLIDDDYRTLLADAFAWAECELHPDCGQDSLGRAREKALAGPCLVALIAVTRTDRPDVPVVEQLVSGGAALQNFLLAARAAGYDSMIVSGEKTNTMTLKVAFGLGPDEQLIGFIALGTATKPPAIKTRPSVNQHFDVWLKGTSNNGVLRRAAAVP